MALTALFRLLFIAYAEDRDLLPYRSNEAYRRRSLKQKAQELADGVASEMPIAEGSSHWQEVSLLWQAVALGNREWAIPAYDGGLFTDDASVSPAGAELAGIVVPNPAFEAALRALLVIETVEDVPGPVDFRSLGGARVRHDLRGAAGIGAGAGGDRPGAQPQGHLCAGPQGRSGLGGRRRDLPAQPVRCPQVLGWSKRTGCTPART